MQTIKMKNRHCNDLGHEQNNNYCILVLYLCEYDFLLSQNFTCNKNKNKMK